MDDKRNLILAAVLTMAILFGWPYIATRFFPAPPPPAVQAPATTAPATPAGTAAPNSIEGTSAIRPIAQILPASPRVIIDTPKLHGSINLKGARIDDIVLPTYRETIAKDSPPVRLLSPVGTRDAYFAGFGWNGAGVKTPDANALWTADAKLLTPKTPVTLSWDNGAGQRFRIRFSVDDAYMLTVAQTIENVGAAPISVRTYGYVSRTLDTPPEASGTLHIGPMGVFDGAANYDVSYASLAGGSNGFWNSMFGRSTPPRPGAL